MKHGLTQQQSLSVRHCSHSTCFIKKTCAALRSKNTSCFCWIHAGPTSITDVYWEEVDRGLGSWQNHWMSFPPNDLMIHKISSFNDLVLVWLDSQVHRSMGSLETHQPQQVNPSARHSHGELDKFEILTAQSEQIKMFSNCKRQVFELRCRHPCSHGQGRSADW